MGERFDEEFFQDYFCCSSDFCDSNCGKSKKKTISFFIQSEIDLAVAKKEKEIVERIEKISIPRDMYYKKIIDKIINIITTK